MEDNDNDAAMTLSPACSGGAFGGSVLQEMKSNDSGWLMLGQSYFSKLVFDFIHTIY
jgi:hypothetical protein